MSFSAPSGNEGNHLAPPSTDGGSGQRLSLRGRSQSPASIVNGGGTKRSRENNDKNKSHNDKSWAELVGRSNPA